MHVLPTSSTNGHKFKLSLVTVALPSDGKSVQSSEGRREGSGRERRGTGSRGTRHGLGRPMRAARVQSMPRADKDGIGVPHKRVAVGR